MKTKYYKTLDSNHVAQFSQTDYTDYLPKGNRPGKWLPKIEDIEMCYRGYHVCERKDIIEWANDELYEVKIRGEIIDGGDKLVAEQMRFIRRVDGWNEKNLRLGSASVIEKFVIPEFKKYFPDDTTFDTLVSVMRHYANGKATYDELLAAQSMAWSAAINAAEASAARYAAMYAAKSAAMYAASDATSYTASSVASSAAMSKASDAASSAVWDAACEVILKQCGV